MIPYVCDIIYYCQVKFVMYSGGEAKVFVLFDGTGTDKSSWFDKDKYLSSSWTDIDPAFFNGTIGRFFSMAGQ